MAQATRLRFRSSGSLAAAQDFGLAAWPAALGDGNLLPVIDAQSDADTAAALYCAHMHGADSVWGLCLCFRLAERRGWRMCDADNQLLALVECWRRGEDEAARYVAHEQAAALGFARPASMLALAAFLAGKSIAPPNMDAVPPAPHAAGVAARAALALAAAETPHVRAGDFTSLAREIVHGGNGRETFLALLQPAGAA